ncbi:MAG: hypothetical protein AB7O92_21995 [Acidimicrobiia bacterium]
MTTQESFKKRVRARMVHTGERYAAARRVLLEQAEARRGTPRTRERVSEPELDDATVRAATGRDWDEWCDLLDRWPGRDTGHAAIAAHLLAEHGIDSWWAQSVTVGYERITGRRLPYQRSDGTFTATRSRTVPVPPEQLRALLLDAGARTDLLGGLPSELRSRPTSKAIRLAVEQGMVLISLDVTADGRTKVSVAHERLPQPDDLERWRYFWGEWLDALDGSAG